VHKAVKDKQALQEHKAVRVKQEVEHKDLKVKPELQAHKDLKVKLELRGLKVVKEFPAQVEHKVIQGNDGGYSGAFYVYDSTDNTDSDPGSGKFKVNNSTWSSISFVYIDNLDGNGNTQTTWYDAWDDSTSNDRGYLYIKIYSWIRSKL